jgi:short-subunit dehydrogenase involved in D-alanine esterification of teichoic acids
VRQRSKVVQHTLKTNFIGALSVTQAMLPLLRSSSAGRIVNVSSGLRSLALNADPNLEFAPHKYLG